MVLLLWKTILERDQIVLIIPWLLTLFGIIDGFNGS
jgi:hypothetical protein